jgi:aryl-alcohol dehydrogenase-like predicted oxidoreductase
MGVIVKEALANGRLTSHAPNGPSGVRRTVLAGEAERLGVAIDALALAAAVARPWADVVLSGAVTVGQLRSNLAALEVIWDAAAEERLDALVEPAEAYWSRRSELPWS